MSSDGTSLSCLSCGSTYNMDELGNLVGKDRTITIPEWYEWERRKVIIMGSVNNDANLPKVQIRAGQKLENCKTKAEISLFNKVDVNHDGTITQDEIHKYNQAKANKGNNAGTANKSSKNEELRKLNTQIKKFNTAIKALNALTMFNRIKYWI